MSKFNTAVTRPAVASPIRTEADANGITHEGAPGFARSDAKSELFLLAVANMVGEHTFYEKAGQRDERYERLVHEVAVADAGWTLEFLRWLRGDGNMRSASLVGAAEAVRARLDAAKVGEVGNGARNRQIIDAVLQRADEPGEMLAYWTSRYGRAIPKPVKRGVGDAVGRLYTERALLKYDTDSKGFRFGDVLDLVHPTPNSAWQGDLFRHALDRRHGRGNEPDESLQMIRSNLAWRAMVADDSELVFNPETLKLAGVTWEDALSAVGSKVDKGRLWSALIPSMGLMALSRNLRNFDEAGVPDDIAEQVCARFADPEQVARSRMFPFRWLAAYQHAPSLRWGHALEKALAASLANVPALTGRTLILVDRSPSMFPGYWFSTQNKSDISLADQAAVFGVTLALRSGNATLAVYGGSSREVAVPRGGSLLRVVEGLGGAIDSTDTASALRRHYASHDRVVIVTDEQTMGHGGQDVPSAAGIPDRVPVYTWNMAGYQHGSTAGGRNRHTFGGLTDAAFRLIPLLEGGRNGDWPWIGGTVTPSR